MLKILYFADPMGGFNESVEDEAKYTKQWLKGHIFDKKKFSFKLAEGTMELEELNYDILIFDFGGIGLGAGGMVSSISRQILKLIDNRPNTLFICWTHFTNEYLKDECEKELGEYNNLVCRTMNHIKVIESIKKWIKENE